MIKFEAAIEEYINFKKLKIKKSTIITNNRKINKYILPYFKGKYIENITFKDYSNWQIIINNFNFSYNYKSSMHYIFCDFFDYCMNNYNLKSNVAKLNGNFINNSISKIGKIWTLEEFNKFINKVDNNIYKCLFNLLYYTGVRKSEALALTWNDINFNYGYVIINKQISRYLENGHKIFTTTKTRSSNRNITLDSLLIDELKNLYNYYKNNYYDFNHNWFVFGGKNSISETQLKRKKDYYCELANVEKIKIHDFRHCHACLLFINNVPIEDISQRLGHTNLSTTMNVYLKYLPKDEKRVINTLNSIRLN